MSQDEASTFEPPSFLVGELRERALAVARGLAATASERDRQGGTARLERDAIRRSGLLAASIDKALGGDGASWPEILDIVRSWARVDGSLAHLFGFQHLLLATVRLFGTREQWEPLHRETVEKRWFWGNALNPLDESTTLVEKTPGHFVLHGTKSFSSGSVDADRLIVSAIDESTRRLVVAVLPPDRSGLRVVGDWDNFGQRQTDSGSVVFSDVQVREDDLLRRPGPLGSTFASLRPLLAQAILANVYLGIAEGAFLEGRRHTASRKTAWFKSNVTSAAQDPYVLHRFGDLFVAVESARVLADRAAATLGAAFARGDELTTEERGRAAIHVASAKVATTRAALGVTNEIFEATGARSTAARFNFDRFWRNARTHTLHDPVDYKLRELGEFALLHELPQPTFYS